MTKDIKEILDITETADYKRLSVDEIIVIKDYISNLQEENDRHFKEAIRYENACDELEIRIDKAIEYCRLNKEFTPRLEDIENILQGSDE